MDSCITAAHSLSLSSCPQLPLLLACTSPGLHVVPHQFPIHHFLSMLLMPVTQLTYESLATTNETSDGLNFIIPVLSIDYVSAAYDINISV